MERDSRDYKFDKEDVEINETMSGTVKPDLYEEDWDVKDSRKNDFSYVPRQKAPEVEVEEPVAKKSKSERPVVEEVRAEAATSERVRSEEPAAEQVRSEAAEAEVDDRDSQPVFRDVDELEWFSLYRWMPEGVTRDDLTPDCTYENFSRMNNARQREFYSIPAEERKDWAASFVDNYCEKHGLDFGDKVREGCTRDCIEACDRSSDKAWLSDAVRGIPVVGKAFNWVSEKVSNLAMRADVGMHSDFSSGWATFADCVGWVGNAASRFSDVASTIGRKAHDYVVDHDLGGFVKGGALAVGGTAAFGMGPVGAVAGTAMLAGGGYKVFEELRERGVLSRFGIDPDDKARAEPVEVKAESDFRMNVDAPLQAAYAVPGLPGVSTSEPDFGFSV